jgi:glycosyltransferase involved in cell wall biosynthesis
MQRHGNCLVEAGFDVVLVGRVLPNSVPLKPMSFDQFRFKCWFNKGKLFYIEFQIRLFFFLISKPADCYVAIDHDTLLPNFIVAKMKGVKLVHDAHEYFVEVPELHHRNISRFLWDSIGNACIEQCDLVYTVADDLALELSNRYQAVFKTIRNVPPLLSNNQKQNIQHNPPILLYQGALNQGRGLEQLVLAVHQLPVLLWIVGEGDLSQELRNLVAQEGLQEKVKFWGFIEPSGLKAITEQATIAYNLLEPNGLSYQFSLANKFFDYMHAGIPQLCANFIAYQKINELYPVALLLDCNTDSIVTAVEQLLSNKNLYETLKENCLKASKVFNLQVESTKLVSYYQQLCN